MIPIVRASPRALVSQVSQLKKRQKTPIQQKLYLPRLLSSFSIQRAGAAGHLCLALSASHLFLDFGEAVGFHPFFASYFILHNSYIRILAIHRYKSSWRCSQNLELKHRTLNSQTITTQSNRITDGPLDCHVMAPDPYLSNQGLIEETVQKDNQQFNKVDSAADNQAKESYITFLLGILLTDTKQLQQLLESHPSFESPHTKNTCKT